jgi:hypothetical protein
VIHIENLLHPSQLCCFHLWLIYWLPFVCMPHTFSHLATRPYRETNQKISNSLKLHWETYLSRRLIYNWTYIYLKEYYLTIFWDMTPCSLLKVNRHFRATYRLRLPSVFHLLSCWYILLWLILRPWRWRLYVPSKRLLNFTMN